MITENMIYSLNSISLVAGICILILMRLWGGFSTKAYFRAAKISLAASAAFAVLFYNKGGINGWYEASSFSVLFYVTVVAAAFVWMSLSYRWLVSADVPAAGFCLLSLAACLCFCLILEAVNLFFLAAAVTGLAIVQIGFLYFSRASGDIHTLIGRYGGSVAFFALAAVFFLWPAGPENWGYAALEAYHEAGAPTRVIAASAAVVMLMLFMLAVAPLHFCFVDIVSSTVLPVAAYFTLLLPLPLWGAFIKLNAALSLIISAELKHLYIACGIFSVLVGALGANAGRNVRKIFAFACLYNSGIILLTLQFFTPEAILSAYVALETYILAMFGIYAAFYGFKSGGDDVVNLGTLNGLAKVRPFIGGAVLLFMASLAGLAPLPGFWEQLNVLGFFASETSFGIIMVLLVALLILTAAFLKVIKALYFADRLTEFDRPDFGVYFGLWLISALLLLLMFKPQFLLQNAETILAAVAR